MTAQTILYIVIAAVAAFALVLFMYGYKTKYAGKLRWVFGLLRFVTLFSLFLLLINPKFRSETYTIEKPKLSVLVDNSASIKALERDDEVRGVVGALRNNSDLNEKFQLDFFHFGSDFASLDSINFSENSTNIHQALESSTALFKDELAATILITDGNQTLGSDYEFTSRLYRSPIYPVIAGDSVQYVDLKIEQLNTNRYSFLKNQFPVEVILLYSGTGTVATQFVITQGNSRVFSKSLQFSETNNTQTIATTLPATKVGLQRYNAQLIPLDGEKNTVNNSKSFAVEVIDQATQVLIVSDIVHPDLGALRKSIETNEQRRVVFKKSSEAASLVNESQLVILYQPTRRFAAVFGEIEKLRKNTWTITGAQTDWSFLNSIQENFRKNDTGQWEEVSGELNQNYGAYAVEDIGFNEFPPLRADFGELAIQVPHEVLLSQLIDGYSTGSPLFASTEINGKRDAILDGEGIWRWRAQSYLEQENFRPFDEFLGNIVQFLASNKRRSRLEVAFESFYYNNTMLKVSAQYFDKNFVFDNRARLSISLFNTDTEETTIFPMLLKNNFFEVDLNSLEAGNYNFTVSVEEEGIARSGSFTILEFNVEQQFLNADVTKLERVATNTGGTAYFINDMESLVDDLLQDENFRSVQKTDQKVVPLIDWKYLLGLIVVALSLEWFIRKYNGLI